ncbi:hypothetical protein COEREDRAFT_87183 [Coemansia reversa NRRL 1564]|uniref:Uncharacterized protein n=1 Tax=Coemansia reversa (strain ATCC 12441 / NRRL 1564) TaxID=763665 RepID=A0A2G5BB29_COERN|nr:hypothetical protein COEREDRAFT_87183 [Coemansia reversa NRRL 1564]|eukprot:PIA16216.1 hypothetical protein COEREDRAFT_87183 [Coemansia reversa NRRL 1564]
MRNCTILSCFSTTFHRISTAVRHMLHSNRSRSHIQNGSAKPTNRIKSVSIIQNPMTIRLQDQSGAAKPIHCTMGVSSVENFEPIRTQKQKCLVRKSQIIKQVRLDVSDLRQAIDEYCGRVERLQNNFDFSDSKVNCKLSKALNEEAEILERRAIEIISGKSLPVLKIPIRSCSIENFNYNPLQWPAEASVSGKSKGNYQQFTSVNPPNRSVSVFQLETLADLANMLPSVPTSTNTEIESIKMPDSTNDNFYLVSYNGKYDQLNITNPSSHCF